MSESDFVVERIIDTGRIDARGSFILRTERSHFSDLRSAVTCYNNTVFLRSFGSRVRLLRSRSDKSFDVLAIADSDSPVIPTLDFDIISASLTVGRTSQSTLEVF